VAETHGGSGLAKPEDNRWDRAVNQFVALSIALLQLPAKDGGGILVLIFRKGHSCGMPREAHLKPRNGDENSAKPLFHISKALSLPAFFVHQTKYDPDNRFWKFCNI